MIIYGVAERIVLDFSSSSLLTSVDNSAEDSTVEPVQNDEQSENTAEVASNEPVTNAEPAAEPVQENTAAVEQTGNGDTSYVVVVLPSGSDSDDCARILREAGVISDGVEYNNYLISTGKDRLIRSGTKQIPRGASFEEITSIITR